MHTEYFIFFQPKGLKTESCYADAMVYIFGGKMETERETCSLSGTIFDAFDLTGLFYALAFLLSLILLLTCF